MKYLVAAAPEFEERDQATAGDLVIPAPPAPIQHAFISVTSLRPCSAADVVEVSDEQVEAAIDALAEQLPGIPKDILSDYVVLTAVGVSEVPVGERLRVMMTEDTATLHNAGRKILLWARAPGFK